MALSATGQRTLEQVKTGLCILYGADYFTEDEWIKLDGLIHKGKYVFTNGPPQNHLEEELMTFDDSEDVLNLNHKDPILETVRESPVESVNPLSVFDDPPPVEDEAEEQVSPITSNESEEEAETKSIIGPAEDEDEEGTPAPSTVPANTGPPNGLAAGYTQAQLDEVKAFNAGLTKAGGKKRPKYPQVVEETSYPSPAWSEHGEDGLPTAAEQDARITSWADEVNEVEPVPEISPSRSPSVPAPVVAPGPSPAVVEQFVKSHGRQPVLNDIYQPNNPEWKGRPASALADTRSSSSKTRAQQKSRGKPNFHGAVGAVYLARSAFQKTNSMTLEVLPGDQIQYIKHVSGITHRGANLRTKLQGHFPETVFEPSPDDIAEQQRTAMYGRGRGRTNSFASNALDKVEAMNAAEWDRESVSSRPTTAGGPPPSAGRGLGGLAGSRFANLAESESSRSPSFTQADIRQIIREELAQAPNTRAKLRELHQTATPHEGALTNILPKTNTCWFWKNKNDCRFTAEECRDLHADIPPVDGEPTNLRGGKPTWGSLADALPPPPAPVPNASTPNIDFKIFSKSKTCYYWATDGKCANSAEDCKYLHEYTSAGVAPKPHGYHNFKKDFNWNKKNSTSKIDEDWHANSNSRLPSTLQASAKEPSAWDQPLGTQSSAWEQSETAQSTALGAPPEGDWSTPKNDQSWSTPQNEESLIQTSWGIEDMNEDHLNNPNAAIWGAVEGSSAWDTSGDPNEPPHLKALREKQRIEAVGW